MIITIIIIIIIPIIIVNHVHLLLPHYQRQRKCFFFWERERERDQDLDTKKEQALFITFSQSDCFIAQNDPLWFAITTRNSSHKNSESREGDRKVERLFANIIIICSNCSVIANIQAKLLSFCGICNDTAIEETIWKGKGTGHWKKK